MIAAATPLGRSLAMLAGRIGGTSDPWWIIGSAAVALHGAIVEPEDIDVVMSPGDAAAFLAAVRADLGPVSPSERFSSGVFGCWREPPIPVEVMADLRVHGRPLRIASRQEVRIGSFSAFIPDRVEMIAILHGFGREKDRLRAAMLESLSG